MTTRAVLLLLVSVVAVWGFTTPPRVYSIVAVPQSQVEITDAFWAPKIETNRTVSIQHILRKYEESGRFDSPRIIEAAAYMLSKRRDPELERQINALIAGRLLATMLFGVRPLDPTTFAAVGIVLSITAIASVAAPAWHATRIDPALALRSE